ncbi:hypothetical protein O6H91_03G031800 [Diphasiastrum complanatum]|uniref:Uncharacterized protein n=1 Tax=Diphasiastrum complanatum TaxID=34168 RepID=A0ACC2E575_DIPCM|nr:hypothetical protein O6H91_03G031800 [Diphasiastrum complanatum]
MICQPFPSGSLARSQPSICTGFLSIPSLADERSVWSDGLKQSSLSASISVHYWHSEPYQLISVKKRWKSLSKDIHSSGCIRQCGEVAALANGRSSTADKHKDCLRVQEISYRPPGTEAFILKNVTFSLPEKSLGLIYGRSGSGKTTLLQILAGLAMPTKGLVQFGKKGDVNISSQQRTLSNKVGIVFQFPERYFLTDSIIEELTFGWPKNTNDLYLRETLVARVQAAISAVGLYKVPMDLNPRALSDGYKRRLALAVQLVQMPDLLLLDEPLAGLDWNARADVVKVLRRLKQEQTLIVVSHDLKELMQLVDKAWRMEMGGVLVEQKVPLDV